MSPLKIKRVRETFIRNPLRVIAKFFLPGTEKHVLNIIKRVLLLSEEECQQILTSVIEDFSERHYDIERIFLNHYKNIEDFLPKNSNYSQNRQKLLGACFTKEYSIESAALFNPSIVPHPNQEDLPSDSIRFILSFRATGEQHISSIVFRTGVLLRGNKWKFDPVSPFVELPDGSLGKLNKKSFKMKLNQMYQDSDKINQIFSELPDKFHFNQLQINIDEMKEHETNSGTTVEKEILKTAEWIAECNYQVFFRSDSDISERVIFPVSEEEKKGIEDARFVRFVDDDGTVIYYGTYTAYDGRNTLPMLLETKDFLRFEMRMLYGNAARNKDVALFPRKINEKYMMIGRQDGENMYLIESENILKWNDAILFQTPKFSWEIVKIGNCGSPIETEEGWLLLTHGVGPVRRYCIGAVLLDLENPLTLIGKMKDPLLMPNEFEREGYVPNVVYTCGAMIHNDILIIPYAFSDITSGLVTVSLRSLLDNLKSI
ncbi:MAG: glycoside hydrolase family 130 protein [Promethearchaeota archaeon]